MSATQSKENLWESDYAETCLAPTGLNAKNLSMNMIENYVTGFKQSNAPAQGSSTRKSLLNQSKESSHNSTAMNSVRKESAEVRRLMTEENLSSTALKQSKM